MHYSTSRDAAALRSSILQSVLEGQTIVEVDKNIREIYGDDALNYIELDHWFHKFSAGNHNLSAKTFMENMTEDEKEKKNGVPKFGVADWLLLQKVFSYQAIPQQNYTDFKSIELNCSYGCAQVIYDGTKLHFVEDKSGCSMKTFVTDNQKEEGATMLHGHHFIAMSFKAFQFHLSNPLLRLESLRIRVSDYANEKNRLEARAQIDRLQEFLIGLPKQLHVEKLHVRGLKLEDMPSILSNMKAGVLQSIELECLEKNGCDELDWGTIRKLSLLDQWAQASDLAMYFKLRSPAKLPIDCFLNFSQITMFNEISYGIEVQQIEAILESFPKIEKLKFKTRLSFQQLCQVLNPFILIIPIDAHLSRAVYPVSNPIAFFDINMEFVDVHYSTIIFTKKHDAVHF